MFKTFFKKASISFVFALILGCGCGKDNLFAADNMIENGHNSAQTTDITAQIDQITNSTTHTNDEKCQALKDLHTIHKDHKDHLEAVKKIESAINTLNCPK